MPGGVARWYISLGVALVLAVCAVSARAWAQAESVWVREGLDGSEVRALVVDRDGGRPAALLARSGAESPLRLRGQRGWTQPDPSSLPNLVLALGAPAEGGIIIGTGRDVADAPGVFHGTGSPISYHRLYDGQAIGALATAPGRGGPDVYAATAPWADRDVTPELLRRDAASASWTSVLRGSLVCGPQPPFFRQVEVFNGDPRTVFALEWCFQSVLRQTQLWRSADRGQSWQFFQPRRPGPYARVFAVDPANADVLYVGRFDNASQPEYGIDVSRDGGQSWQAAGATVEGFSQIRALLVDPRAPGRVLAGTERSGVLQSDDYGRSWQSLPGLEGLRVWALALDQDGGRLYAATGDGVWSTPLPAPKTDAS